MDDGINWKSLSMLAGVSALVSISRGYAWNDPMSGKFSAGAMVQNFATCMVIAAITNGVDTYWALPMGIGLFVSAFLSLVTLKVLGAFATTVFESVGNAWLQWFVNFRFKQPTATTVEVPDASKPADTNPKP